MLKRVTFLIKHNFSFLLQKIYSVVMVGTYGPGWARGYFPVAMACMLGTISRARSFLFLLLTKGIFLSLHGSMEGFSRRSWKRIDLPCLLLLLLVAEGLLKLFPQMSVQTERGVSVESKRG